MEKVDTSVVLNEGIKVIEECFCRFRLDEVFLSFNGGKDCTVLLDLTLKVLRDRFHILDFNKLQIVYLQPNYSFDEVEQFIADIKQGYDLNLIVVSGSNMKQALTEVITNYPNMKACLMGTRSSDPFSSHLKPFQETDSGWPKLMRVCPLLNWSYHQIWSYLLSNKVPYCSLYDIGYTSIGGTQNTIPNKSLEYIDNYTGERKYKPAYLLEDGTLERNGRNINGHIIQSAI